MLTQVKAGSYTISGVSVGGVYTSLSIPELDVIFDVGIAPRSFVGPRFLFVSHGHADHVGSLNSLLGVRGLGKVPPPRIFLPEEIADDVRRAMEHLNLAQRRGAPLDLVPVRPGDVHRLHADLEVAVFRTLHTVPSVGYRLFRRARKLKPEWGELSGPEIRDRRLAGEELFTEVERNEVAYVTDTLVDVLDREPELLGVRTLILECTFLDERKGRGASREKCHVHLDEILERADTFQNEHVVLMHFSQLYRPTEVREILKRRCPARLFEKIVIFAPERGHWPG